ncbi:MAG: sulfotransferase [Rhizobiaceae bacterium]|nr:sulfotransferase [Rhizobiaceae bacterium]
MTNTSSKQELDRALAILSRDSRNVGANIQAGVIYSQQKNWEKSALHLSKALAADKKNPLILEKLSDVALEARQLTKARKYARRLVDIKKRDAGALHTMARVFEAMGDINKALHWLNRALELEPANARLLKDKAEYFSQSGEIEKSLEVHRQILEIDPFSSHSWWPLVQLQKFEKAKAQDIIRKIDAAIAAHSEDSDLRELHFAAAKVHQDIGNYSQAFDHLEKANLLHSREIYADRIIAANINFRETYSKEFFQSRIKTGNREHRPVFILGQTRSGTTLTESLCASHSQITAGGELPHLTDFNARLDYFSTFEKKHHDAVHELSDRKIAEMAQNFISKTRHLREGDQLLTDKMPHNFLNIGLIAILFPNAKIIHCRRHPMDNCLSIFSNPMLDYHKEYKSRLDVLGEYYHNYVQIMKFWKEVCPVPIHDVFYEDLVSNTQNVARGMIDYLELEWEDGVMDRSSSQNTVKTLSVWQVRQPVFQTSKGKWRNYEKQLKPLRDILGDYIDEYEAELAALDKN